MEDRCVCCGAVIPEGRQVCLICDKKIYGNGTGGQKMVNEKRLIDANAEIKKLKDGFCLNCANYHGILCDTCEISEAIRIMDDAPTVDAVEVVRCKDCKHLEISGCYGECGRAYLGIVKPLDFCSYGERRVE